MTQVPDTTRAIVTSEPTGNPPAPAFRFETLGTSEPAADEVIVRMVATGICHSDLVLAASPGQGDWVLGHEGAGYVIKTGQDITKVAVGDPVLLSFTFCGTCDSCTASPQKPVYCSQFWALNLGSVADAFTLSGQPIRGSFFGQSSFAHYSRVKENSICNVASLIRSEAELKLLAPLGCGLQTGAGTVTNVAAVGPESTVMVLGLGGVGLGAIMAAAIAGCRAIIAVDRVPSRLAMATELGATHTIDTSDGAAELAAEVRKISPAGANAVIDTTGVDALLKASLDSLAKAGQLILLAASPKENHVFGIPYAESQAKHITIRFVVEGEADPREFIPKMIEWYQEGRFPMEKLVTFFPAEEFGRAIEEMNGGGVIKPVLLW